MELTPTTAPAPQKHDFRPMVGQEARLELCKLGYNVPNDIFDYCVLGMLVTLAREVVDLQAKVMWLKTVKADK